MTLAAPRPNDFAALRELFAALRDETISTDQWRQVEKTLQQDARARAYFARLMQLHVLLEHKFADASPHKEYPYPSLVGNETAAPVATLSPTLPTVFPVLANTLPSTVGWFSSGWPVAYLIATVIFGDRAVGRLHWCMYPSRYRSPGNPCSPLPREGAGDELP